MENLELTTDEKRELEKRGFLIKSNFGFWNMIENVFILIISTGITLYMSFIPVSIILLVAFGIWKISSNDLLLNFGLGLGFLLEIILLLIPIINYIYSYLHTGKIFITRSGRIEFGKIMKSLEDKANYLFYINNLTLKFINSGAGGIGMTIIGLILITPLCLLLLKIPFIFTIFGSLIILLMIGRIILQSFHPLYAFGNIGEKIQKITPQIEEQSQKIQSEFEKDMNFYVLHSGFEKLSSTFSEIVSLVLKLERVEARANKGNLFDSEKYINSLRSDIVAPLSSLQQFLENQKVELLKSQKELTRVRVGGNEESGNIELQSKRSEPLITELDTNIGALSEMIGKMK